MDDNMIKNNVAKKAILLGWNVTILKNDTIVIRKKKIKMTNFEKDTTMLLKILLKNNTYDTSIFKQ
jgi:hypothetical protein